MSDDESEQLLDSIVGDASRRDLLKTGALATAGAGLATGAASAQEDGGDDENGILEEDQVRVATFKDSFRGGARFMITSGVIEWVPNVPPNLGGPFTGYNTHMASYLNTAERFHLFVRQGENLGANYDEDAGWFVDDEANGGGGGGDGGGFNQPALYELDNRYSLYEGTDNIVTAYAYPVEQDVQDQVFNAEGFNDEGDVNDFLF